MENVLRENYGILRPGSYVSILRCVNDPTFTHVSTVNFLQLLPSQGITDRDFSDETCASS